MSDNKRYKGQDLLIEGSRSGAEVASTQLAYNASNQVEYIGEAKFGTSDKAPNWYIEKITYDVSENATNIQTAINKIYTGIITIDIDITSNAPNLTIKLTGLDQNVKDLININDSINLTTIINGNLIQGNIIDYNKITDIMIIDHIVSAVAETGTVLGATDFMITLNSPIAKDFNKRVWDLRTQYIYQ